MNTSKPFFILKISTYAPLWFLGIILIFGIIGRVTGIGWLKAAPDVLMIPMLLAYYISLIMGAIYGFVKSEDSVYMMAVLGIAAWLVGLLISGFTSFDREIMYVINGIFIATFLVLHIFQFIATKKWETRMIASNRD